MKSLHFGSVGSNYSFCIEPAVYFTGVRRSHFTDMYSISAQFYRPPKISQAQSYRPPKISQAPDEKQRIFEKLGRVRRPEQITESGSIHKEARFPILMLRLLGVLPLQASSVTGTTSVVTASYSITH
jgi:hypothetical protein